MKMLLLGLLFTASAVFARDAGSVVPGALNYVEGQVALDGQTVLPKDIGSAQLAVNGVIETNQGKAELLLTPGVFLRLADHSAVRLLSAGLADTRVELLSGEAMLQADQLFPENHLVVLDRGAATTIEKKGLYRFQADGAAAVGVIDGEAQVVSGDSRVELKKGRQTAVPVPLQAVKFDRNAEDALYSWSKLRDEYVAEASEATARTIVVNNGGFYGSGWYWNPYWGSYGFLPAAGFLYSPFGYGFASPFAYYGGGFYRPYGGYYRVRPGFRAQGVPMRVGPAPRVSGFVAGGFHGGHRR